MSQSWSCSGRLPHTEKLTGAWCLKSECNKNYYENITSKETGWMGCFKHNCSMYMSCMGCRGGVHIIRGLLGKQRTTSPQHIMASGSTSPLLPSSYQTGYSHRFLSLAMFQWTLPAIVSWTLNGPCPICWLASFLTNSLFLFPFIVKIYTFCGSTQSYHNNTDYIAHEQCISLEMLITYQVLFLHTQPWSSFCFTFFLLFMVLIPATTPLL